MCRSPTARQALTRANERASELIALLVTQGVIRTDIATRSIAIHPHYDDKGQKVTGYEASNDVVVVLRDLSRAGEVIDAAAGAVGDDIRMGSLTFGIEDPTAVLADARRAAVEKATSQARQLAAAAGVRLGPIRRIAEGTGGERASAVSPDDARARRRSRPDRAGKPEAVGLGRDRVGDRPARPALTLPLGQISTRNSGSRLRAISSAAVTPSGPGMS